MDKTKSILEYYVLTSKLKEVIRSGWKRWNIKASRLESVAEHIYGTCMLAIAIWSETLPPVNLSEVLLTLALHETEEIIIGDITPFDEGYKDKNVIGKEAVENIFKNMVAKDVFTQLINNFNNKTTPEGIFAYKCDKLECVLQSKLYDDNGFCNLDNADKDILKNATVDKLKNAGVKKISTIFNITERENISKYSYEREENVFINILKYIEKNSLKDFMSINKNKS